MNGTSAGASREMNDELRSLMWIYSRQGLEDWDDASADLKRKAGEWLSAAGIAEGEEEVEAMLAGELQGKFIPMPRDKAGKGFERSFFQPAIRAGELRSLTLFLLVNRAREESLAFRFECERRGRGTRHGYTHVQLTRYLLVAGGRFPLRGVPEWLPASYPAFPVPAHDSLELFLAMATAVHGFPGGVDTWIVRLHQRARIGRGAQYVARLRSMLASLA